MSSLPPDETAEPKTAAPTAAEPEAPPPDSEPALPEPPTTSTIGVREFIRSAAVPPQPGLDWKRIALFAAIGLVLVAGALIIVWQVGPKLGPGLFIAASAIALLPVPFLAFFFLWLDRFHPPSRWRYPVFAFAWGACASTAISLMVNTGGSMLFKELGWPDWRVAVLVAPVIEELTKAMAPLLLLLLRRREVISITDAVMYAGLSAAGFAMTENVLYLGGVYISGQQLQGELGAVMGVVSLVVVRLGFTGFVHPLFTVMTGLGLGIAAARYGPAALRWLYPPVGLLVAMLMHGAWNFMATQAQRDPRYLGYVYLIGALPVLFGFLVIAIWSRGAPGRTLRRILPEYARAGWLSPPELGSLVTLRRRLWARRWAQQVAGDEGAVAMRGYQAAWTKLALLRDLQSRGEPAGVLLAEERTLLEEANRHRTVFTGRDPSVPAAWWDGRRYRIQLPDGSHRDADPPRTLVMPVPTLRPVWVPRAPAMAYGAPYGQPWHHPAPYQQQYPPPGGYR